mgnify:CR=1 FL=1
MILFLDFSIFFFSVSHEQFTAYFNEYAVWDHLKYR